MQVERQGRVGTDLVRLKIEREQIDKLLCDTIDFNQRIFDPKAWQKKLRGRNAEEQ